MNRPGLLRRCVAEATAAFVLVFLVGGAAAEVGAGKGELGLAAMAAVSGLAVASMIYATGHLSGAHINPAVTIAFTVTRHFPLREAAGYIASQLLGAAGAGLVLLACFTDAPNNLGANVPGAAVTTALLYELLLSAFLMFVIVAVATDTRATGAAAAIAIGAVVTVDILVGGGISGASMNPARSFGPALASGTWEHFWIYILGPIAGATLGALLYEYIRAPDTPPAGDSS